MNESGHRPPHEEPLELDLPERAPPPPPVPEPPQSRPGRNLALLSVVVLCAAASVLYFVVRRPGHPNDATRSAASWMPAATDNASKSAAAPEKLAVPDDPSGAPSLTVTSEPSGATVFVQGEEAGRTPLLGTNEFGKGSDVPLRVELPGYRPWTGTFRGGTNASVRAKLKRK